MLGLAEHLELARGPHYGLKLLKGFGISKHILEVPVRDVIALPLQLLGGIQELLESHHGYGLVHLEAASGWLPSYGGSCVQGEWRMAE